jgi:hypothetical protein
VVTVEASSKIAGYIFQFERALYRLFSSETENPVIGIETDDDVVELKYDADGSINIIFEQDKNSVQDSVHPFQDSSKNLWHSLHIWLDVLEDTRKKYKNVSYCLVTNKEVPNRTFATKLGIANNETEINNCIKEIRQRASKAEGKNALSINAVAEFSDENLYFLIENLKLMDEFGTSSGNHPKTATIQLFQLPPHLQDKGEDFYQSLLGLLVDTCKTGWEQKQQVWVEKSLFTKRLYTEIAACGRKRFCENPIFSTSYKKYLENDTINHLFLRQLHHLKINEKHCKYALGHYWGFYAENVRLRVEGDVLPSAWDARNQLLYERWKSIGMSVETEAEESISEDRLARSIFSRTLDGNYTAPLDGHPTSHPYFTSGNYHDLANKTDHDCFISPK